MHCYTRFLRILYWTEPQKNLMLFKMTIGSKADTGSRDRLVTQQISTHIMTALFCIDLNILLYKLSEK